MDKLQFVYTSDRVNVIRCRDCAHFRPNIHDRGDDSRCALWDAEVRADDYCSKAVCRPLKGGNPQ